MTVVTDPVEVAQQAYGALARADWTALEHLLSPDVTWHVGGSNALTGVHHGREAHFDMLARIIGLTGGTYVLEPRSFSEPSPGTVLVRARLRARSGLTTLDEDVIDQLEVRDGLIVACRTYRQNGHLFDAMVGPRVIDLVQRPRTAALGR